MSLYSKFLPMVEMLPNSIASQAIVWLYACSVGKAKELDQMEAQGLALKDAPIAPLFSHTAKQAVIGNSG